MQSTRRAAVSHAGGVPFRRTCNVAPRCRAQVLKVEITAERVGDVIRKSRCVRGRGRIPAARGGGGITARMSGAHRSAP